MGVTLSGVKEMKKALEEYSEAKKKVSTVVKYHGAQLQQRAQRKAPVKTGALRRSIGLALTDGGLTAEVEAGAEYAAYVEYGTRFMDAQPYMKPAFNEVKEPFLSDVKKALGG